MKKNLSIVLVSVSLLVMPMLASAQFVPPTNLGQTGNTQSNVMNGSGVGSSIANQPTFSTAGVTSQAVTNSGSSGPTLATIIYLVIGYLNLAMYLLMAVAVVMFVWNVIQYYVKPNEDRKQAGLYVMYSLIGFFVILSLWGLVNILSNTFNLGATRPTLNSVTNVFPSN